MPPPLKTPPLLPSLPNHFVATPNPNATEATLDTPPPVLPANQSCAGGPAENWHANYASRSGATISKGVSNGGLPHGAPRAGMARTSRNQDQQQDQDQCGQGASERIPEPCRRNILH